MQCAWWHGSSGSTLYTHTLSLSKAHNDKQGYCPESSQRQGGMNDETFLHLQWAYLKISWLLNQVLKFMF